jgi:hypothetical protein
VVVVVKIQKIILAICLITYTLSNTTTNAQDRQGLLLNAALKLQNDNNVLRKVEPTSDSSIQISPDIKYLTLTGKHILAFSYEGEYAAYNDYSELNYDNHDLSLLGHFDHSLKIDTEFKISYKDEIEEPGTNNSASSLINEFNQTDKKQAAAKFYYGTRKSIGQLVLGIDHSENRYNNNFQNYRDVDRNTLTGTFYYRIAPKTRLLFQASVADYNYQIKSQFPDQSSKENYYLAGVEWDITAKTSGTFKIGYQSKNFEQDVYNDITGLSYMLDMIWKPNTYTKIKLGASKMTRESSQQLTSAFITNTYSINAEHAITPRTELKGQYTYDNDDIVSSQNRTDERHNITLGINHSLLTWLNVSLDYKYIERSSDFEVYNYKANIIGLSLTTNFE